MAEYWHADQSAIFTQDRTAFGYRSDLGIKSMIPCRYLQYNSDGLALIRPINLAGVSVGWLLGLLLLASITANLQAHAADLVVRNARLIDGTGTPPQQGVSIRVRDGVIQEIAPPVGIPEGATVIDAQSGTVIPGLIDGHVHLFSVPGAAFRGDSEEEKLERRRIHFRG